MSAKLKAAIGVLLIVVGIATICFCVFMLRGGEYKYGDVEIQGLADAGDSVVLEAVSFSVTAKQLTDAAQMEIWAGVSEDEAYAHAEKALVEKYAMYRMATANGIVPDEEAVRAEVGYFSALTQIAHEVFDAVTGTRVRQPRARISENKAFCSSPRLI